MVTHDNRCKKRNPPSSTASKPAQKNVSEICVFYRKSSLENPNMQRQCVQSSCSRQLHLWLPPAYCSAFGPPKPQHYSFIYLLICILRICTLDWMPNFISLYKVLHFSMLNLIKSKWLILPQSPLLYFWLVNNVSDWNIVVFAHLRVHISYVLVSFTDWITMHYHYASNWMHYTFLICALLNVQVYDSVSADLQRLNSHFNKRLQRAV